MTNLFKDKQFYDMPFTNLIAEAERAEEELEHGKALLFYQIAEEKSAEETPQTRIKLLMKIGLICQLIAKDNPALTYYQKAENLARTINDEVNLGKIHLEIGHIKERNGQWEEALKNYNKACEIFLTLNSKEYLGQAYLFVGKLFERKSWYDTCIEWYEKSRKVFQECNDLIGPLLAKIRLSAIYYSIGKKEIAEQYLENCKKTPISELEIPSDPIEKITNITTKAELFKDIASLHHYLGLWDDSLQWFEKSYKLYNKIGHIANKIDTATSLSMIHFNQKNWQESEHLLQIAEETSKLVDENNIPHIYGIIGWAYLRKGQLEKATKYLERAREIAERNKNFYDLLEILFALGRLYLFKGKWLKIKLLYDKVIEISNHLQSMRTLAIAYNNLGNLFIVQGENEKAFKFLSLARDIFEKIEHYRGLADSYDNTSMLYKNIGQDDWALYCLERSLEIRHRVNSELGMSESYIRIAAFHTEKGQWNQARLYLEKNLDIWQKAHSLLEIDFWHIQMLYYYIRCGNKEKANEIVNNEKLEIDLKAGNYTQGLRILYNAKAHFYFIYKETEKAKEYYHKVLQLTLDAGFINQLPDTFGNLAKFYEETADTDKALEYLEKKKELENELGLKSSIISTYESLSRIYSSKAHSIKKQFSYEIPLRSDIVSIPIVYPISMEFGRELLPLINISRDRILLNRITSIRQHIASELGVIVPEIELQENLNLNPNEYLIKINGVTVLKEQANLDELLAVGGEQEIISLEGQNCIEPASGLPAVWINKENLGKAEEKGCIMLDSISAIACGLTETIRSYACEFLDRENTYKLLLNFENNHPVILKDIYPGMFSLSEIQKVLKNLLKERVSIIDLKTILETMGDYGRITNNPDVISEYVRIALHRQICSAYQIGENNINAIILDNEIENTISGSIQHSSQGAFLILSPSIGQQILLAIGEKVEEARKKGILPVILCSPQIRPYLRRLTERPFPTLPIIAHNEVPYNMKVNIVETAVMK